MEVGPEHIPYWNMNAYIFDYQTVEEVMESALLLLDYWGMAAILQEFVGLDRDVAWSIDEYDLVNFGYHEW